MAALVVKERPYSSGMNTVTISGFKEGELSELKSMEHHEAREKLIEMLDSRNSGIGSNYARGYGIYGIWFDNEYAYMSVGSSCD